MMIWFDLLALIGLAGAYVLSKPRSLARLPAPPLQAPSQWQGTPPAPTPPSMGPTVIPTASAPGPSSGGPSSGGGPSMASGPEFGPKMMPDKPAATEAPTPATAGHPHADRGHARPRGNKHAPAAQAPTVPSDHRPNPFD